MRKERLVSGAAMRAKPCYRCAACGALLDAKESPVECLCGSGRLEFFHSKGEARRYTVLLEELKHGSIRNLERQVAYPIVIRGVKLGKYVADFSYFRGDDKITEDFKGVDTPLAKFKRAVVEALYSIRIDLVRRT